MAESPAPVKEPARGEAVQPGVLLWLATDEAAWVSELLARDEALAGRVAIHGDRPPSARCLVVVDEVTLPPALADGSWVRERGLPLVVLLTDLTVSAISQVFQHRYLNIKGFFRKSRLGTDLVELGQFVRVLREECSLLRGEDAGGDEHQRLQGMIRADDHEGQAELTSLFVDTKMRRFLHELGQSLDRARATGIKQAGDRLVGHEPDWQGLFGEISRYLRGEYAIGPALGGGRRSSRQPSAAHRDLWETLSDEARGLLELARARPAGLQGLHILIQGETGTGKTLIAHWIRQHLGVARIQHLNVTALAETLVESELFGSVRGGFTDATDRVGALLAAYGGVVFLDEIGDMPLALQSKLLVYLDSYGCRPLGWPAELGDLVAPCFVVAATNRPLDEAIRRGEFREDLYHRFLYKLYLPPLRERKGDLPLLVDLVLQDHRVNVGHHVSGVTYHTLRLLEDYPFKGNFRELEHILSRACALAVREGETILRERHVYRAILELDGKFA